MDVDPVNEPEIRAARFAKHVAIVALANRLDPALPELQELIVRPDATSDEDPDGMRWLQKLNPFGKAHYAEPGKLIIPLQLDEPVLHSWTIARWYLPGIDKRVIRISASHTGLHLFVRNGTTIAATFQDGYIGPNWPDHIEQCRKAGAIIKAFTGLEIKEPDYHLHRVRSIIATKTTEPWGDDWKLEYA